MSDLIMASIVGVAGTVVDSLGGALIGAIFQRDAKRDEAKIEKLKGNIARLKNEISARQEQEQDAIEWTAEMDAGKKSGAIKVALRDRTEAGCGMRPTMAPSDVN